MDSHFTGRGLPDEVKAARIFLKDLVNGKLLFCELPPIYNKEKYGPIIQYDETLKKPEIAEGKINGEAAAEESKEIQLDKSGEIVEKPKKALNDDEFFDEQPDEGDDDPYEGLDNDDLLMLLLEGKPVRGVKLNKDQRRELKFALKRGEVLLFISAIFYSIIL